MNHIRPHLIPESSQTDLRERSHRNNSARSHSAETSTDSDRINIRFVKQIYINGTRKPVRVDSWTSVKKSPKRRTKDTSSSSQLSAEQGVQSTDVVTSKRPKSVPMPKVGDSIPVLYESVEIIPKPTKQERRAKQKELIAEPVYDNFPNPFQHIRHLANEPPAQPQTIIIETFPYNINTFTPGSSPFSGVDMNGFRQVLPDLMHPAFQFPEPPTSSKHVGKLDAKEKHVLPLQNGAMYSDKGIQVTTEPPGSSRHIPPLFAREVIPETECVLIENIYPETQLIMIHQPNHLIPFVVDMNSAVQSAVQIVQQFQGWRHPNMNKSIAPNASVAIQADLNGSYRSDRISDSQFTPVTRTSVEPVAEIPVKHASKTGEIVSQGITQDVNYLPRLLEEPSVCTQIPELNKNDSKTSGQRLMGYLPVEITVVQPLPIGYLMSPIGWPVEHGPAIMECHQTRKDLNIPHVEKQLPVQKATTDCPTVNGIINSGTNSISSEVRYRKKYTAKPCLGKCLCREILMPIAKLTGRNEDSSENEGSENAKSSLGQYLSQPHSGVDVHHDGTSSSVHSGELIEEVELNEEIKPLSSVGMVHIKPTRAPKSMETKVTGEKVKVNRTEDFHQLPREGRYDGSTSGSGRLQTPSKLHTDKWSVEMSATKLLESPERENAFISGPSGGTSQVQMTTERINRITSWSWDRQQTSPGTRNTVKEKGKTTMQDAYEVTKEVTLHTEGAPSVFPLGEAPSITINLPSQTGVRYEMQLGDRNGIRLGINTYTLNADDHRDFTREESKEKTVRSCLPTPRCRRRKISSSMR